MHQISNFSWGTRVYLSSTFAFANVCWRLGFGPNEAGEYGFIVSLQSVLEEKSPPLPLRATFRLHHPMSSKGPYERTRDEPFEFTASSMKSRGFVK
jgi:hypothetical protein